MEPQPDMDSKPKRKGKHDLSFYLLWEGGVICILLSIIVSIAIKISVIITDLMHVIVLHVYSK